MVFKCTLHSQDINRIPKVLVGVLQQAYGAPSTSIGTSTMGMELRDQSSGCACNSQPEVKIDAYHPSTCACHAGIRTASHQTGCHSIDVQSTCSRKMPPYTRVRVDSIEPHRFMSSISQYMGLGVHVCTYLYMYLRYVSFQ
jgi:hypothetical protein